MTIIKLTKSNGKPVSINESEIKTMEDYKEGKPFPVIHTKILLKDDTEFIVTENQDEINKLIKE